MWFSVSSMIVVGTKLGEKVCRRYSLNVAANLNTPSIAPYTESSFQAPVQVGVERDIGSLAGVLVGVEYLLKAKSYEWLHPNVHCVLQSLFGIDMSHVGFAKCLPRAASAYTQ